MGLWRRARGCAVLVAAVALALAPAARTAPPDDAAALAALSERDVYASAAALGDFAPVVEERLAAQVANLEGRGHSVKLAVVGGLRGEDPFAYARRLRERLGFDGTLLVTTASGPVGAAGERSEDSLRGGFVAERVDAVSGPTQRLIEASELAVPPPPRNGGTWRELLVLVGLTLLGGAWAIAWGLRREQRRTRAEAAERRAMLKVGLDALAARADALVAAPGLSGPAGDLVARARTEHTAGMRVVQARGEDITPGVEALHRGLGLLAEAADDAGAPFAAGAPFDGLCAADPAHGPAEGVAPLADLPARVPVCAACRTLAEAGTPPARRLVPVGGRPVPFDEVDLPAGSHPGGPDATEASQAPGPPAPSDR